MHPRFHRNMALLATAFAAEAAWVALPGGAGFGGSPAAGVALYVVLVALIWRRWRPVYVFTVLLQSFAILSVTLLTPLSGVGLTFLWVAFIAAQMWLLLSAPVRQTVMRSYNPGLETSSAAFPLRA